MTDQVTPRDERPRVSIGVPVYQGENFLREALESLLTQTFTDMEILVFDNASTDGTEAICREFEERDSRVQYHRQPTNFGAVKNYNDVFEVGRGEFFKWLAHDDEIFPRFIEECVKALDANPTHVLAYTLHEQVDDTGRRLATGGDIPEFASPDPAVRLRLILNARASKSKARAPHTIFGLIRRSALEQTRLHGFYTGSDRTLNAEMCLIGPFSQVDEILMSSREHEERSISLSAKDRQFHPREVWFAPDHAGKVVFPNWRRLEQLLTAVFRSPLRWRDKLRCVGVTLSWVLNGNWKRLVRDVGLGVVMLVRPATRPR